MAEEISLSHTLAVSKGSLVERKSKATTADLTGNAYAAGVASLTTSSSDLSLGSPANGWAWFCNLSDTNTVEIGVKVSAAHQKFTSLKPGKAITLPLTSQTYTAKTVSGTADLEYVAFVE